MKSTLIVAKATTPTPPWQGGDITNAILLVEDEPRVLIMSAAQMADSLIGSGIDVSSLPTEVQLVPVGEWEGYTRDGNKKTVQVTEEDIAQMVANFDRMGHDLVMDYEHQSLGEGEAPAASWIKKLLNKGKDGLWGVVDWTDRAKNYIKNKEYRFVSPVFQKNFVDPVSGENVGTYLVNAALTNNPFFRELKPIISKQPHIIIKDDSMKKLLTAVCKALGIPETTSEDEIVNKFDSFCQGMTKATADLRSIFEAARVSATAQVSDVNTVIAKGLTASADLLKVYEKMGVAQGGTVEEVIAKISLGTDASKFVARAEYDALKKKIDEQEVGNVIAKALELGKITPASVATLKPWAMRDLPGFQAHLATIADYSAVPLQHIKKDATVENRQPGGELTEVEATVAKNLGIKPEKMKAA